MPKFFSKFRSSFILLSFRYRKSVCIPAPPKRKGKESGSIYTYNRINRSIPVRGTGAGSAAVGTGRRGERGALQRICLLEEILLCEDVHGAGYGRPDGDFRFFVVDHSARVDLFGEAERHLEDKVDEKASVAVNGVAEMFLEDIVGAVEAAVVGPAFRPDLGGIEGGIAVSYQIGRVLFVFDQITVDQVPYFVDLLAEGSRSRAADQVAVHEDIRDLMLGMKEGLPQEILLRRETPVHRGLGKAGTGGNVLGSRILDPVLRDGLDRSIHEQLIKSFFICHFAFLHGKRRTEIRPPEMFGVLTTNILFKKAGDGRFAPTDRKA